MRFEKGADPKRTEEALNRAAYLLSLYASGEVLSGVVGFNNKEIDDKEIEITVDKINKVLGMEVSKEEIGNIFRRLGFTYKEKDYVTKKYVNKAEARFYMKLDDDFYLQYNITLSENEYDDATNVVLEELGDAYGIDLSEYYYEEVD